MHHHLGSRFLGEANTEENDESNHSNSQVGETNRDENELLNGVSQVYEDLLSGVFSIEDVCQIECVVTVKEKIEKLEYHEESESCTTLACIYEKGGHLKKSSKQKDWEYGHYT